MKKLNIRAFQPIHDRELSERYLEGHAQVLKDYGITSISSNRAWMDMPCVYGVVAEDETGTLVGGSRVQVADGIHPLPIEKAIGSMDTRIHEIIQHYSSQGVGELCALWNSKSVAGLGVSVLLARAGISLVPQVGCGILMAICAEHTLKLLRKVGFVVNNSLGDGGKFMYPNENYITQVLGILNASNLDTAESVDRERMLSLMTNPQQIFVEEGSKESIEITYDLILPNK